MAIERRETAPYTPLRVDMPCRACRRLVDFPNRVMISNDLVFEICPECLQGLVLETQLWLDEQSSPTQHDPLEESAHGG